MMIIMDLISFYNENKNNILIGIITFVISIFLLGLFLFDKGSKRKLFYNILIPLIGVRPIFSLMVYVSVGMFAPRI